MTEITDTSATSTSPTSNTDGKQLWITHPAHRSDSSRPLESWGSGRGDKKKTGSKKPKATFQGERGFCVGEQE